MRQFLYHCPMPDELRGERELYRMLCDVAVEQLRWGVVAAVFPRACACCTAQCGYGRELVKRYPDLPERVDITKTGHA